MLSSESEVRCEERRAQLSSLRETLAAARLRVTHITTSLGLQPRPRKVCAMVACPVDPEHRVKEENLPQHAAACRWRQQGYLADDVPLPGERGDVGLVISNEDARCIIQKELCKNPRLITGPAAVGGLVEGCEAKTWQRITVDFTPDERRAIYDYVVAVTAPQRVPPPPELAFSGPYPASRHGPTDDPVGDSLVARLAAERDARRRRISQKKVSTNRKSHLEVLREVIGNQMQLYSEWLSDETADPSTSADRPDHHHDSANVGEASGEVRHGRQSSETVDHRANDQVRNREYDRSKGGSDRGRDNTSRRFEEARHGVRFREDEGRVGVRDRAWGAKDGFRERDSYREDNQRHRDSFGGSESKDRHRERDRSWEAKDRYRERDRSWEAKDKYRERDGGRRDRYRETDTGMGGKSRHRERAGEFRESDKEHVDRRGEAYSERDRGRDDKRSRENNYGSRDKDWERERRAEDRLQDQEVGHRDRNSRREREESEERVEPRFENSANAIVKQERESDEEVTGGELDFGYDLQVKTEEQGDNEIRQGKRKRSKEYDWSDDSEKESKKHNKKKKKKKHKKHKKRKARSSSESESS